MGDKEKKMKDKDKKKHKHCGCGDSHCDCGDDCDCTPEDNCGCQKCNNPDHDDHDCGCKHEHCHCGDDCDCDDEDNCGCGCNHHKQPTEEDIRKVFIELQNALVLSERELQKAKTEAMDNQRIAISYKKDLDRYKERNANIQEEAVNNAVESVAIKIVPILDQFETALKVAQSSADTKGFELIYSGLKRIVEDLGVAEINSLGAEFDADFHNAVSKVGVSDPAKDGKVTAVYQKGYYLTKTNKIIRYAMVEIGEYQK